MHMTGEYSLDHQKVEVLTPTLSLTLAPNPLPNLTLHLTHSLRRACRRSELFSILVLWFLCAAPVHAGLYYSGETYSELPSNWRGFLLDQRTLRNLAVKGTPQNPESPGRTHYLEEAAKLEKKESRTADETADLGAIYLRLGEPAKALAVLRPAGRAYPNTFRIVANLGTTWQMTGDLQQARAWLEQSVRLAPGKYLQAEELHLKLVRLRLAKGQSLDDLFGVRYVTDMGEYEPGYLAAGERSKLPGKAVALAQQLALWLPADATLLWQLAELANVHGDVKNAAAMMDGCVTQFGLNDPELRRHRQLMRAAADQLANNSADTKSPHEKKHAGTLAFRSSRPLVSHIDAVALPSISASGVNVLPWELFAQTTIDAKFRPTFPKYLQELAGKQVSLNGFMQPLRDDLSTFLFIEYPVGCWYCEMPETTGIVYVELPAGKTTTYQRGLVRVIGRLTLNVSDPEDFLYAIRDARVAGVD
jgi:hypothetical protein